MIRRAVVIDTNVVVAAHLTSRPEAPTARILDAMLAARLPFSRCRWNSWPSTAESSCGSPIRKKHGLDADKIDKILTEIALNGIVVETTPTSASPPDPGDQHLWDLLAARPGAVLVTGDAELIRSPPDGASVLSPLRASGFLEALFDGDALREVARLVDVASPQQWRCGRRAAAAAPPSAAAIAAGRVRGTCITSSARDAMSRRSSLVGDGDHDPAARAHLLEVRDHLARTPSCGAMHHDRHVLVDQRDRAVLHLARRVALGVDVGDLLELQRALERDREVDAAPEEEEVLRRCGSSLRRASAIGSSWPSTALPPCAGDRDPASAVISALVRRRAAARRAEPEREQHERDRPGVVKALVEATPISGPAWV